MFDADRPIVSSEQDKLGRSEFAKYLARCMLDHKNPESLVLGLQGSWGSGKTSLINLIIQELHLASTNGLDSEKPVILNFSPWSYSGQNQLIYGFFRRLSSELRRFPYLENSDEIIHHLELYISFFTQQTMPHSLKLRRNWMERLKHPFTKKEEQFAWESGRDPTLVKLELNELLKKLKRKIIIIIDNISRLEAKEVAQILQIVKSMGDYSNTIYLLSYDKEQVAKAIDQIHPGEGMHYLEKLVQLPFDVPPISKQDLENLLLDKLQQLVDIAATDRWDNTYWADIYYSSLKYFFNNSRDITRYLNTLSFSFTRIKEVVNPVDYFSITAIEVFEPAVYIGLRENKDLFTDLLENVYSFDKEKMDEDKLRCDELLTRAHTIPQLILLSLLMHLFPRIRSIYEPDKTFFHNSAKARQLKHVCSPEVFDIYFRLSIPSGYMPESEFTTLIALATDKENFSQSLLRLNQDGRITQFLDLLDGNAIHKIPRDNIANVIYALIDGGDLFPEGESNTLHFNTSMRVHRICLQLLRSLTSSERFIIFEKAINDTSKSLYIIINELALLSQEHTAENESYLPPEHRTFTIEQIHTLQQAAVSKILYWAQIGRLSEHPKLLPLLYAWKNWGNTTDCKQFIKQTIREDKGLLAFLGAALREPVNQAVVKQEKNPAWKDYLVNITNFIAIEDIEPRAKMLFEDEVFEKLREKEQLSLLIFLDLINPNTIKHLPKTTPD